MSCEVCHQVASKYKCPRCSMKTCSLSCVKQHKTNQDCSGQRDKTTYVALKDFDNGHLLSDYRFLEDVGRKSDSACRDTGNKYRNRPRFLNRLVNQAARRGVNLKVLPINFTRRRQNSTYFHERSKQLSWHIEWIFSQAEAKYTDKRIPDGTTVQDCLDRFIHPQKGDAVILQQLRSYARAEPTALRLFIKLEERPANSVRYHELESSLSLADNLKNKTIVEYPTIHVVLPDHAHKYPLLDQGAVKAELESSETSTEAAVAVDIKDTMDNEALINNAETGLCGHTSEARTTQS